MTITHLTRTEGEEILHLSYLWRYISAYEYNKEGFEQLQQDIEEALVETKRTDKSVLVDAIAGECQLEITPGEYIILLLPWKKYKIYNHEKVNNGIE